MMMRSEYMAFKGEEEMYRLFHAYYGEIAEAVNAGRLFSAKEIAACALALAKGDKHLNRVPGMPLRWWDCMVPRLSGAMAELRKRGDWLSLGTGVCILKEAARLKAEAYIDERGGVQAILDAEAARIEDAEAGI